MRIGSLCLFLAGIPYLSTDMQALPSSVLVFCVLVFWL